MDLQRRKGEKGTTRGDKEKNRGKEEKGVKRRQ